MREVRLLCGMLLGAVLSAVVFLGQTQVKAKRPCACDPIHALQKETTPILRRASALDGLSAQRRAELSALIVAPSGHAGAPIQLPAVFPSSTRLESHCDTFRAKEFVCFIEWDEWIMASLLVRPGSAILELGARWGTTSCFLAQFQNNSGRTVAVEPQADAHDLLLHNRETHHCNFYVLKGLVGDQPLRFQPGGYGSRTSMQAEGPLVPNVPFAELEAFVGFQFDTLLLDCEGCIQDVLPLEEHQPMLQNIALILMEEDMADHLRHADQYKHWHMVFVKAGFRRIWHAHDTANPGAAQWSWALRHSAWIRPERFGPDWIGCDEFALRHQVDAERLQCVGGAYGNPHFPRPLN
jgi:FkbM family methyltransferase